MTGADSERKLVASNRRARFEYEILDTFEAGIALLGPEVKSLRAGNANLGDAYAIVRRGEVFLVNVHIGPYDQAGRANAAPRRERKLLLHRARDRAARGQRRRARLHAGAARALLQATGAPRSSSGCARGKKAHDKRETIRERESERELQRAVRGRGRSRP